MHEILAGFLSGRSLVLKLFQNIRQPVWHSGQSVRVGFCTDPSSNSQGAMELCWVTHARANLPHWVGVKKKKKDRKNIGLGVYV